MLALPKRPVRKYKPLLPSTSRISGSLDPNIAFRTDHLSRPPVRILYENKRLYHQNGPRYIKKMDINIDKSWKSIYNYYRYHLRERRLKQIRNQAKLKAKKLQEKDLKKIEETRQQLYNKLATPKKLFLPEKIIRKHVPLEDLLPNIDKLAAPKEYVIIPPRPIGVVSQSALTYEITENVLRLYTSAPERLKKRPSEAPVPGQVARSALRAKCTPRIEKLALPSFSAREAKKKEEDMYDPWVISKNALKYKPTPRILELAKPSERE